MRINLPSLLVCCPFEVNEIVTYFISSQLKPIVSTVNKITARGLPHVLGHLGFGRATCLNILRRFSSITRRALSVNLTANISKSYCDWLKTKAFRWPRLKSLNC